MAKRILLGAVVALLMLQGEAHANNACLLETNATFMDVALEIKDCIQNAGMDKNQFKAQCEGMSQAAVSMGGPAATISYLAACPVPFKAKCDNTHTAKTIFFYYKRPDDELASLKFGCDLIKGRYTEGTL